MRQFLRRSWKHELTPVDIVIEPDGQVWVSIIKPEPFSWNAYEKIEDLRAENYGKPGGPGYVPRRGSSGRSGRASNGYTGRGYHFDEGGQYPPKSDAVDALLANLEDYYRRKW